MNKFPSISLVMASYLRSDLLDISLKSIVANKPTFDFQIVVVNDGLDSDNTKKVCNKYKDVLDIKYVFSGYRNKEGAMVKRCPSVANNIAIRQAEGDIIVLSCPEIFHLNNCLTRIIEPLLENKKALSIPSFMYFDEIGTYTDLLKQNKPVYEFSSLILQDTHVTMPFFMGIWKKEIEEIRGYDEDFIGYASEDNDFINRLLKNKCEFVRTYAQIIHLYHGGSYPVTGEALENNPAWVYNRKLLNSRKNQIIRNRNKDWGKIDSNSDKMDKPLIEFIFTDIYKNRRWSSKETPSGTGSELRATETIRKEIPLLFKKNKIKRVLDIGCGNVNWMRHLFNDFEFYLGIDVVKELVQDNKKQFGSKTINFKHAVITDKLFDSKKELAPYEFDCVILNDVLVHLSYADIFTLLDKIQNSGAKYVLMTHFTEFPANADINTGEWRPLNFTIPPFNFYPPITSIQNIDELIVNDPAGIKRKRAESKTLSLWKMKDFKEDKTKLGPNINGIPKIMHLYWDRSPMAELQTMTVTSFHKHNPDWEIRVYVPIQPYVPANNKYVPDYTGKDHFYKVKNLSYVNVIEVDMEKYGIDTSIHNILQSDIFRYKLLYEVGGLWSDFDVLWTRPITKLLELPVEGNVLAKEMGTFVCRYEAPTYFHNISVLMSKPRHPLYKYIIDECEKIQEENKDREKLLHQEFGTNLFDKLFPTFQDLQKKFSDVVKFPYKTFYPYSILNLGELYKELKIFKAVDEKTVAIHWFNGHRFSKEYINADKDINPNSSMSRILSLIKRGLL